LPVYLYLTKQNFSFAEILAYQLNTLKSLINLMNLEIDILTDVSFNRANALNSVCEKIDALPSTPEMFTCKNFELFIEGTDNTGMRRKLSYTWETADVKKRITVTVIVFVLKLVKWMQSEFSARGIQYDLIVWPVAHTDLEKPAHN